MAMKWHRHNWTFSQYITVIVGFFNFQRVDLKIYNFFLDGKQSVFMAFRSLKRGHGCFAFAGHFYCPTLCTLSWFPDGEEHVKHLESLLTIFLGVALSILSYAIASPTDWEACCFSREKWRHFCKVVRDWFVRQTVKTKGKECGSVFSSRSWGGALRDETKNGCVGDYLAARQDYFDLVAYLPVTQHQNSPNVSKSIGVADSGPLTFYFLNPYSDNNVFILKYPSIPVPLLDLVYSFTSDMFFCLLFFCKKSG